MEQNESQKNTAGNTCAQSDRRTFLIAFLTAVIVLALYHFGTGVFAIFSGKSDCCEVPVAREYMLVPVASIPQPHSGMMGRGPCGFHRGGFHRGEHGGMPHHGRFGKMPHHGRFGKMPHCGKFGKMSHHGRFGKMPHCGKFGKMSPHGQHGHHPEAPAPQAPAEAPAAPAPTPAAAE